MIRILSVVAALLVVSTALAPVGFAQLQAYDQVYQLQFPNGYAVLKQPRSNSEVVKTVPGPTEAAVKGQFTNGAGEVFYLSDWSWDRRARGESHFWMYPRGAAAPPPPPPAQGPQVQVLPRAQTLFFLEGFLIVDGASKWAKQVKRVDGPAEATVKAYVDVEGERFYMSDWSYDRAVKGEAPNWIRPFGKASTDVPGRMPKLPEGYRLTEYPHEMIFEDGYDLVESLSEGARVAKRVREPSEVALAVEVTGPAGIFYLTPDAFSRWSKGEAVSWLRWPKEEANPALVPRMRELAGGKEFRIGNFEMFSASPWWFSAELYGQDRESALVALREFGIAGRLTEVARHYEDREFPGDWLREVARHLEERGTLATEAGKLRDNLPVRERIIRLYEESDEGFEMELSYAHDKKAFEERFLAILEARRGNFAEVERLLAPHVEGWSPREDGLNASGPRINILREVARAQWIQGKEESARESTRLWLTAYSRNIANDLLHPEFVDAAQRVMEFDSDFERVGEYFDLLDAVTDPSVAAEIVIGLKGLRLAVASSLQVRSGHSADPELDALSRELIRLLEQERDAELSGKEEDRDRTHRIEEIQATLALRKLSGAHLELASDPEWARLTREIERMRVADPSSYDLVELREARDLVALDHLAREGGFIARPGEVARRLRAGEVLVDFFLVPPLLVGETGRYGAVVVEPDGSVSLARLGPAGEIDGVVKEFRDLVQSTTESVEALAPRTAAALRRGHDLLVAPLLDRIGEAERIVFCADGQLLFLPFGSLEDGSGTAVQDRWEISYVNAARDLLRESGGDSGSGPGLALLVGNPDFATRVAGSGRGSGGSPGAGALSLDDETRAALVEASRGIEFGQLPGTQAEIESLAPRLEAAGYRVETLTGGGATEARLTGMEGSPAILHLATHGFFLNSLPIGNRDPEKDVDSAMLLSGLALAGAQDTIDRWNEGTVPPTANDGILLASEVSRLDLSGTDTVVLSACETAVGRALSGEGVEGLRSGLTLAGARNVLLTLWPVDDRATVEVMDVFYGKLLAGVPAAQAMAETKRELFRRIAAEEGEYVAHRFVAPFLVTRSGR